MCTGVNFNAKKDPHLYIFNGSLHFWKSSLELALFSKAKLFLTVLQFYIFQQI